MPFKEIKELRQAGKLEEALEMALKEYKEAKQPMEFNVVDAEGNPLDNVELAANLLWPKRALAWVYYEFLKKNASANSYEEFKSYLNKINELQIPKDEKMLFDNCAWQIGKLIYALYDKDGSILLDKTKKLTEIFEIIKVFHFTKPSEAYTFLFKSFQKSHNSGWSKYIEFVEWWGLNNLRPEDFLKEEYNGRKIMSIGEQVYIAYSKNLIEGEASDPLGIKRVANTEKIKEFIPVIDEWIGKHPDYQYLPYNKAKLLLKLGSEENALSAFLPFAKQKRNDFWVWELMAEMHRNDKDMQFACYCKALSLNSPEDYLVKLRQTFAAILIEKKMYDEAKTEIDKIVEIRTAQAWKIPSQILEWKSQPWYASANAKKHNKDLYKAHAEKAEEVLFQDMKEETVIVEFVNEDKKILNFIKDKKTSGFFKYDRFINKPKVGDILLVRFNGKSGEMYKALSLRKADCTIHSDAKRIVKGILKINNPQNFGFIDDCFVESRIIENNKLQNNQKVTAEAILSFNKKKNEWGWKVYKIQ
jgi:tetratricopeptide (TPR) repeat protein